MSQKTTENHWKLPSQLWNGPQTSVGTLHCQMVFDLCFVYFLWTTFEKAPKEKENKLCRKLRKLENSEICWISSENNWFSLWSFLKNTDSALNITDFFWSSHEHCWRKYCTCSPENTVKISQVTPVMFFFLFTGFNLVFFTVFVVLERSFLIWNQKEIQISESWLLECFKRTQ